MKILYESGLDRKFETILLSCPHYTFSKYMHSFICGGDSCIFLTLNEHK